MMVNYTAEDVAGHVAGDVVTIGGKKFFLEEKSSRVIKVRRYYWFDAIWTKLFNLVGLA